MLKEVSVKGFNGVPYLEGSQLMANRQGKIKFSTTKPNVIVGPNGAGKSALLTALSIRFLAHLTGESLFDDKFLDFSREGESFWTRTSSWGNDYEFLKGLDCTTDNAPALYYRPDHIPGNERCIATSMMCGFFTEAKAFAQTVKNKSSGQAHQALLAKVIRALTGEEVPTEYRYQNWRYGKEPKDLQKSDRGFLGSYDWQAEVLKKLLVPAAGAQPLVMMDEPEQSLDARAEAQLWKTISNAGPQVQVIVATHSIFPILSPKRFNLIETEPGYVEAVRSHFNDLLT